MPSCRPSVVGVQVRFPFHLGELRSEHSGCEQHLSVGSVCGDRFRNSFQQESWLLTFLRVGVCLATWPQGRQVCTHPFHSRLTAGLQSQGHTQFSGALLVCWAASFGWDRCRTEEAGTLGGLQSQPPFLPPQALLSSCLRSRARLSASQSHTLNPDKSWPPRMRPATPGWPQRRTHPAVTDPQPHWFPVEFADVS